MTIRIATIALCWLTILLAGCSSIRVLDTKADEGFRLSNYSTFDFYEVETGGDALEAYAPQLDFLRQEIARQLEQRGLKQSSSDPELKINLGLVVASKVQTRETRYGSDAPYYIGQRRYTWKSEEVVVNNYKQGTLSLHLVDNATNKLVWQGAAEGVLPENNTPKIQKRISEGVQKLLQQIP
ncbi:DUF4136 domain-containing protein [Pontibacter burrus]|uniref:DUF4136 domain-containing protein n=1 Tax=Pontibacter burrus TaxID=2704466 RepID=A0A6B3LTW5_9BACT|nr:DUF4136 domain-containing protein [Pontibacter burrus]NEM98455.1 DUF4136 domain-containing protein [Pontibacter burrus]